MSFDYTDSLTACSPWNSWKYTAVFSGVLEMKLSFSIRNFIGGLLTKTTVAAIAIGHPVIALTAQEIPQTKILTDVQVESPLVRGSGVGLEPANFDILHFSRERNILANREEDPQPPISPSSGGSR